MNQLPVLEKNRLRRFVRALKKEDRLARFLASQNSQGEAFLFGGAPRDVVFAGAAEVNDLDMFVSGPIGDSPELNDARQTRFGGMRAQVGRHEVDIWRLQDSAAFRKSLVPIIGVEELLKTVCFSTDAIAISTADRGSVVTLPIFLESFERKRLDFICPPDGLEPVYCARIARLVLKLNLAPTPWVATYFCKGVDLFGVESILRSEERWGERMILNPISIEEVRARINDEISKVRNWSDVATAHLARTPRY